MRRPPVLKSRCWRLVSDQFWMANGRASRRSRLKGQDAAEDVAWGLRRVACSAPPPSRRVSGTMAFAALSPPRDVRCRAAAVLPCGARYRRRCRLRRSPDQSPSCRRTGRNLRGERDTPGSPSRRSSAPGPRDSRRRHGPQEDSPAPAKWRWSRRGTRRLRMVGRPDRPRPRSSQRSCQSSCLPGEPMTV